VANREGYRRLDSPSAADKDREKTGFLTEEGEYAEKEVGKPAVLAEESRWSVLTELVPPSLTNLDPVPSSYAGIGTQIAISVIDNHDVIASSVCITLDGTEVWRNDASNASHPYLTVTKTNLAIGYRYVITRECWFYPVEVHTVNVKAFDLAGNFLDATYSFTITPWNVLTIDDFGASTPTLPQLSGNGTITKSGGQLRYAVGAGVNCDIWVGFRNCKIAYYTLPWLRKHQQYTFETQLGYWTTTNSSISHAILHFPGADLNNFVYIYHQNSSLGYGTMINGSWTDRGNVNPGAAPFKFRVIIDKYSQFTLQYWSGSAWTQVGSSVTLNFKPTIVGFGVKTWSSLPACEARWDYFQISYDNWGVTEAEDPEENGAFEDASRLLNEGPATTNEGQSPFDGVGFQFRGVRPKGSFEDGSWIVSTGGPLGGDVKSVWPNVGLGFWTDEKHGTFEDTGSAQLGSVPNYTQYTVDGLSHFHLIGERPKRLFFYNTSGEPWANPAAYNFTGYARDGYLYTAGVKQVTQAPWATESSGADRSSRQDFPVRSLIAITKSELTIFDLDGFPSELRVWMRFRLGDASNFYLLGRISGSLQDAYMHDGILTVVSAHNGTENGGLFVVNFRSSDQNFIHLIRNDDHWWGVSGRNITHRNTTGNHTTTGPSPEQRANSTSLYSVAVAPKRATDGTYDGLRRYIAVGGDDAGPDVYEHYNSACQTGCTTTGPGSGGSDWTYPRQVLFDEDGWLWFTAWDRLYRVVEDYKQLQLDMNTESLRYGITQVQFPAPIVGLAYARNYIYVLTSLGVYQVRRGDMTYWLAYTISGGGGGGRLNRPPAGELLAGTRSPDGIAARIFAFSLYPCDYLAVGTNVGAGSYTLIRLYDDYIISGNVARTYPSLADPGVWGARAVFF